MTTRPGTPDAGPHDTHDRLLIAARAAGDLVGRDLARADAMLATCDGCRALAAELRSIAAATRRLPSVPRPVDVDFRLSPDRAASLARGGWWRRFLRPFAGGDAVRPLATALTTLGVAGLLLAALPMLPGGGGGTAQPASNGGAETYLLSQESQGQGLLPVAGPSDGSPSGKAQEPGASEVPMLPAPVATSAAAGAPEAATAPPDAADDVRAGTGPARPDGPTPLVLLSLGFLVAGMGLFLLRRAAIRLR